MTHKEYADSLRMIAEFFEAHEEVKLPRGANNMDYFNAMNKEEMAVVAKALGSCDKIYDKAFKGSFELSKKFGQITFRAIASREQVCRAVVKGTRTVPERVLPAMNIKEKVIPAHEEEIIEWECGDSILA